MTEYSKQDAREVVQARLDSMTDVDYSAAAGAVRSKVSAVLTELSGSGKLQSVLAYAAAPKWREVDLSPLEREFSGVRFDYVPHDIDAPFPADLYDVILVPLYGFNAEGYRLGHGGGWYDKFLATQPQAHKIGVGLEVGRVDFTAEPHDIPMDSVITERDTMSQLTKIHK
jgi:hypothetical protein